MDRSAYGFAPLAFEQYENIVTSAQMAGNISPLHGQANWAALVRVSQQCDVDPRVALAATLWEDHDGTDPNGGVQLATVYNFGGIKWAGQPGAFDSGIEFPHREGIGPMGTYTYAGFSDFGGFVNELYRTLANDHCGPFFNVGDLANAWSVYIRGRPDSGVGQERVDTWQHYRARYQPDGHDDGPPVVNGNGVYGEDLVAKFQTQIGHARSGDYDRLNGDHPWAFFCEAGAESTGRQCGLSVVPRPSALAKYNAALSQGLIQQGTPEHGAQVFFGLAFFSPDGHTGLWDADRGQLLGTLTDGSGVGYRNWGPQTPGYVGWMRIPGVVGARRPAPANAPPPQVSHPPMGEFFCPAPNPHDPHPDDPQRRIGITGAFLTLYRSAGAMALQIWGLPLANEQQAVVCEADGRQRQMAIQRFERGTILYDPTAPPPWNAVAALETQTITPL